MKKKIILQPIWREIIPVVYVFGVHMMKTFDCSFEIRVLREFLLCKLVSLKACEPILYWVWVPCSIIITFLKPLRHLKLQKPERRLAHSDSVSFFQAKHALLVQSILQKIVKLMLINALQNTHTKPDAMAKYSHELGN